MSQKSQFIWIERDLYKSKAFQELIERSKYGVPALIWFLHCRKFAKKGKSGAKPGRQGSRPIINNGEIEFSYIAAKKRLGISKPTFSKILDHLVDLGFIDQTKVGGGYARECSLFSISDRWRDYGKKNFKKVKRVKNEHATLNSGFKTVKKYLESK